MTCYSEQLGKVVDTRVNLTPDSPDRAIVLEHMPLHASQNRISWSYEPVTRTTDMSLGRAKAGFTVGAGIVCWRNTCTITSALATPTSIQKIQNTTLLTRFMQSSGHLCPGLWFLRCSFSMFNNSLQLRRSKSQVPNAMDLFNCRWVNP